MDTIATNIPLFIRLMEFAREDAKGDLVLHRVAENAYEATKQKGCLRMEDYNNLTAGENRPDMQKFALHRWWSERI